MTLHPVGATSSAANPLVSIVWFGKNRLQWVEKEIGGLLRQDHVDWQLIVEDAGSTDGTLEWFRGLAERDSRVVVASTPGSGPGEALLNALRRCTGDYIAVSPRHAGFAPDAKIRFHPGEPASDAGVPGDTGLRCHCDRSHSG